ncbi:MAG: hypothetical protein DRR42_18250 [Gammaproteobacteria bacterium]|nr:MAG: hypothetical protein DRR42_18250 [Gammaproteobacteria bacterium]
MIRPLLIRPLLVRLLLVKRLLIKGLLIKQRTQLSAILLAALVLTGCATRVDVQGAFPDPVTSQLPVSAVVVFDESFSTHRFERTDTQEVSIIIGHTQVDLFTTVTKSMFREVSFTDSMPAAASADLVLAPKVEEVQISMPYNTHLNVFEVWIKYNIQVFDRSGEPIADWIMSAYGKTPTKFMKSDTKALNLAAIVALRDAGAHFIIGFTQVPEIRHWLDNRAGNMANSPASPPTINPPIASPQKVSLPTADEKQAAL